MAQKHKNISRKLYIENKTEECIRMSRELPKINWSGETSQKRSQLGWMMDESHLCQTTLEMSQLGWVIGIYDVNEIWRYGYKKAKWETPLIWAAFCGAFPHETCCRAQVVQRAQRGKGPRSGFWPILLSTSSLITLPTGLRCFPCKMRPPGQSSQIFHPLILTTPYEAGAVIISTSQIQKLKLRKIK